MSARDVIADLDLSGIPTVPFWRPDSVAILRDKDAIIRFNRYWRILSGKSLAKYLIAKKFAVDEYDPLDENSMWRIHRDYMEEFHDFLNTRNDREILDWYEKSSFPHYNLLRLKHDLSNAIVKSCRFCEFKCNINRAEGAVGRCRVDAKSRIASIFVHIGEEPELVPSYTIFFSGCNFRCVYCQNWDISQRITGVHLPPIEVAIRIDERFQANEIRNVNWVGGDPTPNIHFILGVLLYTNSNVPQVWNSNFYNSIEALQILDGVIDLWLPDFKYGNNECATRLSGAPRYFDVVTRNFKIVNGNGDEILIRHLVLPNHLDCCTKPILRWIHDNLDLSKVRVNVMAQYRPEYQASAYKDISRRLTKDEFNEAIQYARKLELPLTS
ncbi:MAG: radical SAM protein [Crenarchaeota archaeon]|nr:radical SAM protein [Thermoproteota archaeon]MCR8453445.1 radical SAM protein [Thermoproteota archaeon]MCR8454910.1 radical SAM protein [Thermoproteota archaeon]MCR8462796.1 radical SAM protein [Thermoproteota archaeon]MCR8470509.1 radical SAM protein [Thermoproteota archaeon]